MSRTCMILLYNRDCMEAMAEMPDKAYDLAIVDPPYGIGHDARGMSNRASNSPKFRGYEGKQWHADAETREVV